MLPEYKKILCATDLGHTAPQVLRHALSIANRFGWDVVVLHVVEPLGPSAQHMFELYAGTEVARQAEARWQKVQDEVRALVRQFLEREGRPRLLLVIDQFEERAQPLPHDGMVIHDQHGYFFGIPVRHVHLPLPLSGLSPLFRISDAQ